MRNPTFTNLIIGREIEKGISKINQDIRIYVMTFFFLFKVQGCTFLSYFFLAYDMVVGVLDVSKCAA